MPHTGPQRLYELLDALVALRLEFAEGTEGGEALAILGRAKVCEVQTMLETAIATTKVIIGETQRPLP